MLELSRRTARRGNSQGSSETISVGSPACWPPDTPASRSTAAWPPCADAAGTKPCNENIFAVRPCSSSLPPLRQEREEYDKRPNPDLPITRPGERIGLREVTKKKEEDDPLGSGREEDELFRSGEEEPFQNGVETAEFKVPTGGIKNPMLLESHVPVWKDGRFQQGVNGVSAGSSRAPDIALELASGKYEFLLKQGE